MRSHPILLSLATSVSKSNTRIWSAGGSKTKDKIPLHFLAHLLSPFLGSEGTAPSFGILRVSVCSADSRARGNPVAQTVCILHTKANNYLQNILMWLNRSNRTWNWAAYPPKGFPNIDISVNNPVECCFGSPGWPAGAAAAFSPKSGWQLQLGGWVLPPSTENRATLGSACRREPAQLNPQQPSWTPHSHPSPASVSPLNPSTSIFNKHPKELKASLFPCALSLSLQK